MSMLEGLRYPADHAVLHIACLQGCLDYLGAGLSYPWLCGGTGHAFIINIHAEVDVQGTNDWNPQVWLDCRETAVTFLAEAKARLTKAEAQFDAAIAQYRIVADRLRQARELTPTIEISWAERRAFTGPETAVLIRQAGEAEAEALRCLRRTVAAL